MRLMYRIVAQRKACEVIRITLKEKKKMNSGYGTDTVREG